MLGFWLALFISFLFLLQALCMQPQPPWDLVSKSNVMSGELCFVTNVRYLWVLQSFQLFCNGTRVLSEECDADVPFRAKQPTVSYSLYDEQLWVQV